MTYDTATIFDLLQACLSGYIIITFVLGYEYMYTDAVELLRASAEPVNESNPGLTETRTLIFECRVRKTQKLNNERHRP